mgnify:CR=1 FL=1
MATTETRCKNPKCNRVLRSAKSIATGYGPTCAKKIAADTAEFTPEQTAKALRVIQGGGVARVRGSKIGPLFQVAGTYQTYYANPFDCTCQGAADHGSCYHIEAVRLHLAAA